MKRTGEFYRNPRAPQNTSGKSVIEPNIDTVPPKKWTFKVEVASQATLEPQSRLLTLVPYITRCLLVIKEVYTVCADGTSLLSWECGVIGDKQKLEYTKQCT